MLKYQWLINWECILFIYSIIYLLCQATGHILVFLDSPSYLMLFESPATMHFHFVLNLSLLFQIGLNRLRFHLRIIVIFQVIVSCLSRDKCLNPSVEWEPCNASSSGNLLLLVLRDHFLHSAPLPNYVALDTLTLRYSWEISFHRSPVL